MYPLVTLEFKSPDVSTTASADPIVWAMPLVAWVSLVPLPLPSVHVARKPKGSELDVTQAESAWAGVAAAIVKPMAKDAPANRRPRDAENVIWIPLFARAPGWHAH